MFISLTWILFKKNDLLHNAEFVLRNYAAAVIVGGSMIAILYAPLPFTPPDFLSVLMPTRFLNFAIIGYLPLTFGLLWRYRTHSWVRAITAIMIVGLALTVFFYNPSLWYLLLLQIVAFGLLLLMITRNEKSRVENWSVFIVVVLMLTHFLRSSSASISEINITSRTQAALISLAITSALFIAPTILHRMFAKIATPLTSFKESLTRRLFQPSAHPTQIISLTALAAILIWTMPFGDFFKIQKSFADNFHTLPINALTASSRGQIIIGPNCSPTIQLVTRRPVLNYMPINMLPYAIEGAPSMEKILRDIYDMDFFGPPAPTEHTQSVWEKRSTEEWITLAHQYAATEVLVPSAWTIQLTRVANDNTCILYRIPSQ